MDAITVPTTFVAAWIIVLAVVALVVQAVVNQPKWGANVKRGITISIAFVLSLIYMISTGAISAVPANVQAGLVYWFVIFAGILAVAQSVYRFLKPYLATLEAKTSPGSTTET